MKLLVYVILLSLQFQSVAGNNSTTPTPTPTQPPPTTNGKQATPTAGAKSDTRYLMDVVYWEQKPFLFTNKKGEIDGIIPQMFEQANEFCLAGNATVQITNFKRQMGTRKEFYDLVRSNISYGEGALTGIRKKNVFWVPAVAYSKFKNDRNLRAFQLMKSNEIAVIVPRDMISLPNKIIRGILSCQQIFFLAILLATMVGLMLWIIERSHSEEFPKSFIKGVGTGLYWSIVSMTTVGYGDITPKTPMGRFITSIWLFVGVMVSCIVVATMTDVVTGVDDLNVSGQRVSVLEQSYEEKTAEKDFGAVVVTAESYDEVLGLVRRREVFAAMINADIAAWYEEEINDDTQKVPLRIVDKLPANLYINCYLPFDLAVEMKKVFKCMYYSKDEVYTYSIEAFRRYCHTETLYIGTMRELIVNNMFIQVLLGIVCGMVLVGLVYDLYLYWGSVRNSDGGSEEGKGKLMEEKIGMNGYDRYPRM